MAEEFDIKSLDSPLVVHKESDASYSETAGCADIDMIHTESTETSNLVRHRFRKTKKRRRKAPFVILVLVIIVAVISGLYFGGVIGKNEEEKPESSSSRGYIEVTENKFEGIITVKRSFIFFEGEEIDGIEELKRKIKYLDAGTKFVIQDEEAEPTLLDNEILPLLKENGIKYDGPNYIISSGLKSKYETETSKAADPVSTSDANTNTDVE